MNKRCNKNVPWKKIFIGMTTSAILAISAGNVYAADLEQTPYSDKYMRWLELSAEEKKETLEPIKYDIEVPKIKTSLREKSLFASLESNYDLREHVSIPVKDQEDLGCCWTFSNLTSLEVCMRRKLNVNMDLSERHMEYSTIYSFQDGTNYYGFNRVADEGGNGFLALAYLNNGMGAIDESQMPFENNANDLSINAIKNKTVTAVVKDVEIMPSLGKYSTQAKIDYVKQAIKDHSAITIGVLAPQRSSGYFNTSTKALNVDGEESMDHDVTLIGWDDNYPVSNFNSEHRPSNPGAWLVLNSWGESWGNSGTFWVSYEDLVLEPEMCVETAEKATDVSFNKIYQYNPQGGTDEYSLTNNKDEVVVAEVYNTDGEGIEYLTEIGFYLFSANTVELYANTTSGELNNLIKVKDAQYYTPGYHRVKLDNPVRIRGDKFVVCTRNTSDEEACFVALKAREGDSFFTTVPAVQEGRTFIASSINSNNWSDLVKDGLIGTLKAFVDVRDEEYPTEAPYMTYTVDYSEQGKAVIQCKFEDGDGVKVIKKANGAKDVNYFTDNGSSYDAQNLKKLNLNITVTVNDTYTIYAEDTKGNKSVITVNVNSIVDNTAPTFTEITNEVNSENKVVRTIRIEDANSYISEVKYADGDRDIAYFENNGTASDKVSGQAQAFEMTFTVSENKTITLYAKDSSGNEAVYKLVIDNVPHTDQTAPTVTLGEMQQISSSSAKIPLTVEDEESDITLVKYEEGEKDRAYFASNGTTLQVQQVNGSNKKVTTEINVELGKSYTIYVKDSAGNEGLKLITVQSSEETDPDPTPGSDTTAPVIQVISEDKITNGVRLTIKVTDTESNISVIKIEKGEKDKQFFTTGGTQIPISTQGKIQQVEVDLLESGTYTIYAKDAANNEVIITKTVTIETETTPDPTPEDTAAPLIELVNQEKVDGKAKVSLKIKDEENNIKTIKYAKGIKTLEFFANSGTTLEIQQQGLEVNVEFETDSNGVYTIYAEDVKGNKNIKEITVIVLDVINVSGDADKDGKVDEVDLELMKRYIVATNKSEVISDEVISNCDMNKDGKVNLVDLFIIKKGLVVSGEGANESRKTTEEKYEVVNEKNEGLIYKIKKLFIKN